MLTLRAVPIRTSRTQLDMACTKPATQYSLLLSVSKFIQFWLWDVSGALAATGAVAWLLADGAHKQITTARTVRTLSARTLQYSPRVVGIYNHFKALEQ